MCGLLLDMLFYIFISITNYMVDDPELRTEPWESSTSAQSPEIQGADRRGWPSPPGVEGCGSCPSEGRRLCLKNT